MSSRESASQNSTCLYIEFFTWAKGGYSMFLWWLVRVLLFFPLLLGMPIICHAPCFCALVEAILGVEFLLGWFSVDAILEYVAHFPTSRTQTSFPFVDHLLIVISYLNYSFKWDPHEDFNIYSGISSS